MRIKKVCSDLIFFFVFLTCYTSAAFADLKWSCKGTEYNLTKIGIYKGLGLGLAPGVNNGASSLFGGVLSPEPPPANKLLFLNYQQFIHFDRLMDHKGSSVDHRLNAATYAMFNRILYTSPISFANGNARIIPEIAIPWATSRVKVDGEVYKRSGMGDIKVGASVYWKNMFSVKGNGFDGFIGLDLSLPTANYKKDHLNLGSNIYELLFFFETFALLDIGVGEGLLWKNHLQFNYYTENDDFVNPVTHDRDSTYLFGHYFQYNCMLAYKFSRETGLGIAGFYNQQLFNDKMDSHEIRNSKEMSLGIGPLVTYAAHHIECSLRTIFIVDAENYPEGSVTTLIFNFIF